MVTVRIVGGRKAEVENDNQTNLIVGTKNILIVKHFVGSQGVEERG